MLNQWLNSIQNLLLPHHCLLCSQMLHGATDLCPACADELPWIKHGCIHCGVSVALAGSLCPQCQQQAPLYDLGYAPFQYRYPLDYLVQQFKFHHNLACGQLLGEQLLQFLRRERQLPPPQAILPVPLHRHRLRERGFNQSLQLAQYLARHLGLTLDYNLLARQRQTESQSLLDARQRRRNVRGAFHLTRTPNYSHVALVDDVVTTGATINEISRLLKSRGVEHIEVWSVARA